MVNVLNYKVTDHCHRTDNYRGAAHIRCTINYYNNRHLPVFFIIWGYGSHVSLKEAFELCGAYKNITDIPK